MDAGEIATLKLANTISTILFSFSESANEPQKLINDLKRESLKVGLKMNRGKTKVMFKSRVQLEQMHVEGEVLECFLPNMTYEEKTWATTKLLERKQPRARPMTRRRDEITEFPDRSGWKRLEEAYILQWTGTSGW
ncbi:uncharacterized protein [Penaeus vannamei]|uniref:uncharacterized protein n=1 Tax=Penaeus vannamei TaxID=6689 RepID=UPI00387F3803